MKHTRSVRQPVSICHLGAIVLGVILAAAIVPDRSWAQDTGLPDSIFVDSARVVIPKSARVNLSILNDELLTGVEVTVRSSSAALQWDSATFSPSRIGTLAYKGYHISAGAITIYGIVFNESLIPRGGGVLATLHASYPGSILPQLISIDTTTVTESQRDYGTFLWDAEGDQFIPRVRDGYLDLQNSCCVGTRGNADGSVGIDVDPSDLQYLIDWLFTLDGWRPFPCPEEANIDGSADENIDASDLQYLVEYIFFGLIPELPPCQ